MIQSGTEKHPLYFLKSNLNYQTRNLYRHNIPHSRLDVASIQIEPDFLLHAVTIRTGLVSQDALQFILKTKGGGFLNPN